MSIEKLGPGKYRVRTRGPRNPKTGKRPFYSRVVNGSKQAAKAVEVELSRSAEPRAVSLTVGEVGREWLDAARLEENSIAYYRRGMDSFGALSDFLVSGVDSDDVNALLDSIPAGYSRRRARKTLSALMSYAYKRGYIDENPVARSMVPDGVAQPKRDRYSPDEMALLLEIFHGSPIEAAVLLGVSGLRREEIAGMDYANLHLTGPRCFARVERATVDIDSRVVDKAPKTAGSYRDVPLGGYPLERLREIAKDSGRVCPVEPRTLSKRFRREIEKDGRLRYVRFGNLRHGWASAAIDSAGTAAASTIKTVMGHTKFETTAKYIVAISSDADDLAATVGDSFRPNAHTMRTL